MLESLLFNQRSKRRIMVYGLPIDAVRAIKERYAPVCNGNGRSQDGDLAVFNTGGLRYLGEDDIDTHVGEQLPDLLILGCYHHDGEDTGRAYEEILTQLRKRYVPVVLVGSRKDICERLAANFTDIVGDTAFFPDQSGRPAEEKNVAYLLTAIDKQLTRNFILRYRLGIVGAGNATQDFVMNGLLGAEKLPFSSLTIYTRTRKEAELLKTGVEHYRANSANPNLEVNIVDNLDDLLLNSGSILVTAGDSQREGPNRTSLLAMVDDYLRGFIVPLADTINKTGYDGHVTVYSNPTEWLATALYARTRLKRISAVSTLDKIRYERSLRDILATNLFGEISNLEFSIIGLHSAGFLTVPHKTLRINGLPIRSLRIENLERVLKEALERATQLPLTVRAATGGAPLASESANALVDHIMALRRVPGHEETIAGINVMPEPYLSLPPNLSQSVRSCFPNGVVMSVPTRFTTTMLPRPVTDRRYPKMPDPISVKLHEPASRSLLIRLMEMREKLLEDHITAIVPEIRDYFTKKWGS